MPVKIGFARRDITPPNGLFMIGYYSDRRAEGTLDSLMGHCIAFSDGERTAVVYCIDNLGINYEESQKMRDVICKATGLPDEAVYTACTHTHTGPGIYKHSVYGNCPEYNAILYKLLADAAVEAIADMSDAKVFINRGEVKGISHIRRYKMKDGSTRTNPGRGNPDIDHPISTPDESLQLVRVTREGKDDIVILNFQCHPDTVSISKYSADWPGWAERIFEGALPNTKCVLFNGAQGDTNHCNIDPDAPYVKGHMMHTRHMGLCIAGEAMKLYTYAQPMECDRVDFIDHTFKVPSNRGTPEQIKQAEKYIEAYEAKRFSEIPGQGMELTTIVAEAYRMKRLENGPDYFDMKLRAVRFGDIAFSSIPGEPFTDVGRGIKEGSPFTMTIPCCCANGYQAYFPMKSAYDEGGYEARSSSYCAGIAEEIIDESINMLKKIH